MGIERKAGAIARREKSRSFDMMASVDMMGADIINFGRILPETRLRVHDEEMSLMAEGLDRVMRTPFTLRRQDDTLVIFEDGKMRPYIGMLMTGLEVAREEAKSDKRKQFLYEMSIGDLERGYKLQALKPGEHMTWTSPYPQDAENFFGTAFMTKCGFFPERKAGFIYLASCNDDGTVTLESQMVDSSDPQAFERVEAVAQYDPDADLDTLVRSYDGELVKQYGGRFYAGSRRAKHGENAWEELLRHQDLVSFYMQSLEVLAWSDEPRLTVEQKTRQLIMGVWKAFRKRLDKQTERQSVRTPPRQVYDVSSGVSAVQMAVIGREVSIGYLEAVLNREIKPGCGGSVSAIGENGVGYIDGLAIFDSIFGDEKPFANDSKEKKYGFDKEMFCVVCQAPPQKQEGKKKCGPCGICEGCDTKIRAKEKGKLALDG